MPLCTRVHLGVPGCTWMRQGAAGCFLVCQDDFIRWVWWGVVRCGQVWFLDTLSKNHTCLIDASMQLHMHTMMHPDALWVRQGAAECFLVCQDDFIRCVWLCVVVCGCVWSGVVFRRTHFP